MGIISSPAEHPRRIDPGVEKLYFSSREQLVNERSPCGRGFLVLKSKDLDFDTLGLFFRPPVSTYFGAIFLRVG